MSSVITHIYGEMESDPTPGQLAALIEELDLADEEHPDVAVSDESGWTLSAFSDGRVLWQNVEDGDEEFLLAGVPRGEVLRLFELVAASGLEAIHKEPWVRRA
jgi:hypothetical protein